MTKMIMDDAFNKIQPLCSTIAKKYTAQDLLDLKSILENFDNYSFQSLQEYIIFPIQLNLYKEKESNAIIECVKFLNFVFRSTSISSWKLFWKILEQITYFITLKTETVQNPSEEVIQSICECIVSTFLSADEEILLQLYDVNYSPALAHYIYSLLALLKQSKSKNVCTAILDAIAVMLYCHQDFSRTPGVKVRARKRAAAFLPGASIALRNIICGDLKQGYMTFIKALDLFGELIALTLEDNTLENETFEESNISSISENLKNSLPCVIRNDQWVTKTASKLIVIFENMNTIFSHSNWKVRLSLTNCIATILDNCILNLEICILPLLQILFALSVDEYEQVSMCAQNVIKHCLTKDKLKTLNIILKEDMDIICSKLISIHMTINDERKLFLLKAVHGYFQLLGPSINTLLYSFSHLNKFCKTFLKLIQFDTSNVIFLEQSFVTIDVNTNIPKLWPKKNFLYFHDNEIISQVQSIFYVIGFYGDIQLVVDYFMEKFHDYEYKNESLFLIMCTIAGLNKNQYSDHIFLDLNNVKLSNVNDNFKIDLITNVIEEFLSAENFEISHDDEDQSNRLESHNSDVSRICLILESLSNFAQILGSEFQPLLMHVLCPIMEKAGSSITVISESGKLTLHSIALYCDYSSVMQLITENVDYIINSITIGFCHFLQKAEMAIVLKVALELAKSDVLLLFKDPLDQLLLCLDHNQKKAVFVMRILLSVVGAIKLWYSDSSKNTKTKISVNHTDLKTYLLERHRLKTVANEFDINISEDISELPENNIEEEEFSYDEEKKELPFHVKLTCDILERCIHYQSSKNLELCILTLSIIENSIVALRTEIEKILPYVHKIWKPLVSCFSHDLIVMKKAFETLLVIANECGDFIKSRTMKEIWPKLLNFLKSQENVHCNKRNASNYQLSNSYKFLLLLLSEIGNLAIKIDLTEKEFELLTWSCLPFLKLNQPKTLRTAVSKSLICLNQIDSDAFWFHYNEAYGNQNCMVPKHSCLCKIQFLANEPSIVATHITYELLPS